MTDPMRTNSRGRYARRLPPYLMTGLIAGVLGLMTTLSLAQQPAPAPAAPASGEQAIEHKTPKTIWDMAIAGGAFMIPIGIASMIGVAIVIERLVALRRRNVVPGGFLDGLAGAFAAGGRSTALDYCASNGSPIARVCAAGVKKMHRGPDAVEKSIEDAGAIEAIRLRRYMRVLYAIASVATMLGLIGTIQGMIMAFQEASKHGTGKFGPLAEGIYTALITTFAGLAVAIPLTLCYFWFVSKIETLVTEMNDAANAFVEEHVEGAVALPTLSRDTTAQPAAAPPAGWTNPSPAPAT